MSESMARSSTRLLRESDEPLFRRLRVLLAERGIDSGRSALAALFPDDTDMEFGVVVAQDKRVYEFQLHYAKGDIAHAVEGATITAWDDRSAWWDSDPFSSDIREAMELIVDSR